LANGTSWAPASRARSAASTVFVNPTTR